MKSVKAVIEKQIINRVWNDVGKYDTTDINNLISKRISSRTGYVILYLVNNPIRDLLKKEVNN